MMARKRSCAHGAQLAETDRARSAQSLRPRFPNAQWRARPRSREGSWSFGVPGATGRPGGPPEMPPFADETTTARDRPGGDSRTLLVADQSRHVQSRFLIPNRRLSIDEGLGRISGSLPTTLRRTFRSIVDSMATAASTRILSACTARLALVPKSSAKCCAAHRRSRWGLRVALFASKILMAIFYHRLSRKA